MLKKFFSMFFEDLQWKVLALAAASVLWFIGMNMSNPPLNMAVSPRLQLDNLGVAGHYGIMVLNEDLLRDINVSVTVRSLRSYMDVLRAAQHDQEMLANIIDVNVDFRAIDRDAVFEADGVSVQRLRINPNLQAGFEHLSISPAFVDVYLDVAESQMFPVQTVQHGVVSPGFELQHIRLRNEIVSVTGARTDLRTISLVQAHVEVSSVHGDADLPIPLRVIDENGDDITERVHLSVEETTASVSIWEVRPVDIRVSGTGSPAAGFAVAGISDALQTFDVVGPAEILDEIDHIRAEVNLAGASADVTQMLAVSEWLPEGVSLRQGEYHTMNVTVRIEPIEDRVFIVPRENVRSRGVVGLFQLVDDNEPIRVNISGPRSIIAALNASEISPEFDLRELPMGVHTVPLMFDLPAGLSVVGAPPTLLVQIHEPAAPNAESTAPYNDDEPQGSDDDDSELN